MYKRKSTVIVSALFMAMTLNACGKENASVPSEKPAETDSPTETVNPDINDWEEMRILKEISPDEIDMITVLRTTEGGIEKLNETESEEIAEICQLLKNVTILEETSMCYDDDGLGIDIKAGKETISFSFEHDVLVMNDGRRYTTENIMQLTSLIDSLIEDEE